MTLSNEFTLLQRTQMPNQAETLLEFRHDVTGARHIHIQSEDRENAFMVVLKTIPKDETGVAHILEHLALCGSKQFPVRDPFFMMLRRSLNTYMNASTANDHTSYYFASQNEKDYFNLMQVYCDAVFFPLLHPLDFAQEGHRQAFNQDDKLEYRGIVYNEMKGAMSDFNSQIWQKMNELLYPNTTYQFNSGGEPVDIPSLSYEALKSFHETFYHPSNAIFCTAGNIDHEAIQAKISNWVLNAFNQTQPVQSVDIQPKLNETCIETLGFPAHGMGGTNTANHLRSWLLDRATDVDAWIMAKVISYLLVGDAASPLMQVLETNALAKCPSSLTGLHAYFQQMSFMVGIEQANHEDQAQWITMIDEALERIKAEGFSQERIAAVFDQFELQLRDRSQHTPHGIQLLSRCVLPALHQAPVSEFLFLDEALKRCRKQLDDPKVISDWIDTWLIHNPHQVILTAIPDPSLIAQQEDAVLTDMAATLAMLSEADKVAIRDAESALQARQAEEQDIQVLPSLTHEDLGQPKSMLQPQWSSFEPMAINHYCMPTQGLSFQSFMLMLPKVAVEQWHMVALWADCLGEMGVKGYDYLAHEQRQTRFTGGIGVDLFFTHHEGHMVAGLQLETKLLNRHFKEALKILHEIWTGAEFANTQRFKELVAQFAADSVESIAYQGHRLAMLAAWSQVSEVGYLNHLTSGLLQTAYLKQCAQAIEADAHKATELQAALGQWQAEISGQSVPGQVLWVNDEAKVDPSLLSNWPINAEKPTEQPRIALTQKPQVWLCDVQVNYVGKSIKTVDMHHGDAPALAVLSQILTNGYLHRVIREQAGAYGGGAAYRPMSGEFSFYSYRDPNDLKTLDAFNGSVDWVVNADWPMHLLDEACISLVGQMDRPETPMGEPKRILFNAFAGFTVADRDAYRAALLTVSRDDVLAVAKRYLVDPKHVGVALVVPKTNAAAFSSDDYVCIEL